MLANLYEYITGPGATTLKNLRDRGAASRRTTGLHPPAEQRQRQRQNRTEHGLTC